MAYGLKACSCHPLIISEGKALFADVEKLSGIFFVIIIIIYLFIFIQGYSI